MSRSPFALCAALLLCAVAVRADAPSAYVGQQSREIKALSAQQIADYLAGNGMGLAKAAELNGYPGPAHVLELAAALELSAQQRTSTEALFAAMQSRAIALGKELIEAERALDRHFAARTIDAQILAQAVAGIAGVQAQLRQVHLDAHLAQVQVLTAPQVAKYAQLRGHAGSGGHGAGHGRRHH